MKFIFFTRFFNKIFFLSCFFVCTMLSRSIERSSISFSKEESINGINFKQKFEIDNGSKKESYFLNGLSVDQLEYEESILEAEKEERRIERQRDDQIRQNFAQLYYKAESKILQSELNYKIKELQAALEKLSNKKLEPYILFGKDGFENKEQLQDISTNFILKVKDFAVKSDKNKDIKKVQEYSSKIAEYTQKANNTFIATINNAIDKADDTHLLKELLGLIS